MDENVIKRIQPYSEEAERSVIGSMIMDPEAITVAEELLVDEDFYDRRYRAIFNAILRLHRKLVGVDFVTVQNALSEDGVPEEVRSLVFLSSLTDSVPTSANVENYAKIVKEKSLSRKLIKAAETIANKCYLGKEDIESVLDESEKAIFDISQQRQFKEFTPIVEVVSQALRNLETAAKNHSTLTGVSTGFIDLDDMTAGLQKSDLVLLAGRPSMGKTALALNIAEHAVIKRNVTTAIFSLEMSSLQLVNRLLAMNSRVSSQVMRTGRLQPADWTAVVESARLLGGSMLFIDDTPGITADEIRSKCRKLKLEKNLGLVIIDYLQLMQGKGKVESRVLEISNISRSLKALARELDCPVLALSQLSRAVEQRPDKRPILSDLRESGAIEQDADVVMFIYRDEVYNHDTEDKGVAEVIIGKQRNGPTGRVRLGCRLEHSRFTNLERQRKAAVSDGE
ncbi:MAG: replicative DNA helicase [Lachnospiraceae bacterium]|nr:replicative DNA helicase [Lachnospiraceae bacterium]